MNNVKYIQSCQDDFLENPTGDKLVSWIKGITQFIVNKKTQKKVEDLLTFPDGLEDIQDDEWVTMQDFIYIYPRFCYPGSLSASLREDKNFLAWCGKFEKGKFFIQHKRAIQYLSIYGKSRFRNRARKVVNGIPI